MERIRKHSAAGGFRSLAKGIWPELFVAGILAIVLALALARAFLPVIGLVAFAAMILVGSSVLRARQGLTWFGIPAWGIVGFLAIVWIAAGRLLTLEQIERWFR